jgi:outer membrane protein OmpA-like peptidoglycan-associated protein
MSMTRMPVLFAALLGAALVAGAALAPPGLAQENNRFLIYFDEFSANLTTQARGVIADAAQKARERNTKAIRIEARASATGSQKANHYLAQTRSQVVADELEHDGVNPAMVTQVPIGQTGSDDPSVAERRVDIVLER